MSKIHFVIGQLTSETVSSDQIVWAMMPESIEPATVPTYSAQLYPGTKVLVKISSAKNIFTSQFLPLVGAVDKDALAAKKRQLESVRAEIDKLSGDAAKRAQIFVNYLSVNKLIDRKLYPVVERLKRDLPLSNKDLTPLIDAVYTSLRKNAGASSAHKDKIRAYLQGGEYDTQLIEWFQRFVDPRFGLFQQANRLTNEVEESEKSNRVTADPTLMRNFCEAIDELAAGRPSDVEIENVQLQSWLENLLGTKPQPRFFAEVRAVKSGMNKSGCLRLEAPAGTDDGVEPRIKSIALDQFSRMVTAFDRALSTLLTDYANADPEIKNLVGEQTVQPGLLIRAFLGEADAVRTLYPKHVVGIPGKPDIDDALIARTRAAFDSGLMARLCAGVHGLEEQTMQQCLAKTVATQQKIVPLLPFEIYQLADVGETSGRLKKMLEKLESGAPQTNNPAQLRAVNISLKSQTARGQQLAKRLKADFRVDPTNLFRLEPSVVDDIEELFGSELASLRTVLARHFEPEPTEAKEDEAAAEQPQDVQLAGESNNPPLADSTVP